MKVEDLIKELKNNVQKEKKASRELTILYKELNKLKGDEEKKMMNSQIKALKKNLHNSNERAIRNLKNIYMAKPLSKTIKKEELKIPKIIKQPVPQSFSEKTASTPAPLKKRKRLLKLDKNLRPQGLEKETLKRLRKKEEKVKKVKKKKPNKYAKAANKVFSKISIKALDKPMFRTLERDLIKSNMQYTPTTYISIIYFTTLLSIFAGILLAAFFLFFKITADLPIIHLITNDLGVRIFKVIWLVIVVPVVVFFIMYLYPSMEKKSIAHKIDHELPFATINMAAISGSLIDPSKIFQIIITTKEYPYLSREFTKIMNEINIHGYNFVGALRNTAFNSSSKKLSELLSGLATTINSGGDLPNFFEERAKTLLFEHKIETEKQSKASETFMDVYISLAVATPMILMLLLVMMKISGLGISMSTSTLSLIMVLGVSVLNIVFLTFLQLRKES